jgi:hypothetical protein
MRLNKRKRHVDDNTWRCAKHEKSIRTYSFYEKTRFAIPDCMQFTKNYLMKTTLLQASINAGINYKSTAVEWAKRHRQLFKEWVWEVVLDAPLQFQGVVEIDESMFGRRTKHNRGNSTGMKVGYSTGYSTIIMLFRNC